MNTIARQMEPIGLEYFPPYERANVFSRRDSEREKGRWMFRRETKRNITEEVVRGS